MYGETERPARPQRATNNLRAALHEGACDHDALTFESFSCANDRCARKLVGSVETRATHAPPACSAASERPRMTCLGFSDEQLLGSCLSDLSG